MRRSSVSQVLGSFMIGMGIAMIIQTLRAGGGWGLHNGYVLGGGLILAGLLRLYLVRATSSRRTSDSDGSAS